jgi:hypothetical protein
MTGVPQGDRLFISCNDVERRLASKQPLPFKWRGFAVARLNQAGFAHGRHLPATLKDDGRPTLRERQTIGMR